MRRSLLGLGGLLAVVLTACTGRGGGQLPPQVGEEGVQVRLVQGALHLLEDVRHLGDHPDARS